MYHCHLDFYLAGSPCRAFDLIREIPPVKCFSHDFYESASPEADRLASSDVIILNVCGGDIADIIRLVTENKRQTAHLIIIAVKEDIPHIAENFPEITDIWASPMSDSEIRFRFSNWQKAYKMKMDFWESKNFFESAFNSSPNLVWYKDREGIHEKVNDSFCRTVSKTKKQVEGRDHYYIWDADPNDPANQNCMESDIEVMENRRMFVAEETVLSGGEEKLLTTYKSPLYDVDGSVMGTVGIGVDITQERAYEQEILKKNHVLESIFSSVDCGILCHSVDGKRIINVNRTALKILGYSSYDDFARDFDMIAGSVEEEDKQILRDTIKSLKNEGDSVSIEYRINHGNGEVLHVMSNIKLLCENGELFYQRSLLDCTAQKKQEEENEQRQTELIQALSIDYSCIFFLDLDSGVCSPLRAGDNSNSIVDALNADSPFEENIKNYIQNFVCGEDRDMMLKFLSVGFIRENLLSNKKLYSNFRTVKNSETEYYEVKIVRAGLWRKKRGAVLGFRSVNEETRMEMEQKKILEDALTQAQSANKAKSVFLSNMSHDIRTPMNAIIGFTNLAIAKIDQTEKVKDYLYKIMMSGNHLLSLINDVLDISQIESGKLQLEESFCNIPEFLADLCSMIHNDLREKNLDFKIETSVVNEDIYCDKLQLNRALTNIINNSIKYTDNGGKIRFYITEKDGVSSGYSEYEFCIKDTGIGMSEEFISRIFELFARERNTTNSGIQGTGLGMAITKNIVDLMNGTIEVKSEQGTGTEVVIRFMFRIDSEKTQEKETPAVVEPENIFAEKNDKGVRILLVEDNELNQEIATEILNEAGFSADVAENGEKAVKMLSESEHGYYRVILMDIQMPVMNGYEATKAIRSLPDRKLSRIPIIAMTANAFAEDEQETLKSGMNGHLAKPIDIKKLIDILNRYCK